MRPQVAVSFHLSSLWGTVMEAGKGHDTAKLSPTVKLHTD